jgi:hypothetical protein
MTIGRPTDQRWTHKHLTAVHWPACKCCRARGAWIGGSLQAEPQFAASSCSWASALKVPFLLGRHGRRSRGFSPNFGRNAGRGFGPVSWARKRAGKCAAVAVSHGAGDTLALLELLFREPKLAIATVRGDRQCGCRADLSLRLARSLLGLILADHAVLWSGGEAETI